MITYTDRFLSPIGYELPPIFERGCVNCGVYLRSWAPKIAGNLLVARPFSEWRQGELVPIVVGLVAQWKADNPEWVNQDIGAILAALLSAAFDDCAVLYLGNQEIDVPRILEEVREIKPHSYGAEQLVQKIREWARPASIHPKTTSITA